MQALSTSCSLDFPCGTTEHWWTNSTSVNAENSACNNLERWALLGFSEGLVCSASRGKRLWIASERICVVFSWNIMFVIIVRQNRVYDLTETKEPKLSSCTKRDFFVFALLACVGFLFHRRGWKWTNCRGNRLNGAESHRTLSLLAGL